MSKSFGPNCATNASSIVTMGFVLKRFLTNVSP